MHSRIFTPPSSRMKFLLVASALLSVGLVQALDCPSEGVACQDPSGVGDADIDCNVGVLTWEDCGKFDLNIGLDFTRVRTWAKYSNSNLHMYRVTILLGKNIPLIQLRQLLCHYCSCLLPRQDSGTSQI